MHKKTAAAVEAYEEKFNSCLTVVDRHLLTFKDHRERHELIIAKYDLELYIDIMRFIKTHKYTIEMFIKTVGLSHNGFFELLNNFKLRLLPSEEIKILQLIS